MFPGTLLEKVLPKIRVEEIFTGIFGVCRLVLNNVYSGIK